MLTILTILTNESRTIENLYVFSNVFWNAKNGLRIPSFFGQKKWASHNNRVKQEKIWMPMGDVPAMVDDTVMGHAINHH